VDLLHREQGPGWVRLGFFGDNSRVGNGESQEPAANKYTFGDNPRASFRLRRLAEIYEPESRELLRRSGIFAPRLAVDLGCGPGWSTRLLDAELKPRRTVGLDASAVFVEEARTRHGAGLEFKVHDIVSVPFPVDAPADVLFCRFLLTHLRSLGEVFAGWARVAAPGGLLLVHETESLEADHPALRLYYRLLDQLQQRHGQKLHVGAVLENGFAGSGWRIVESRRLLLEKPAVDMAELHLANLRTWRDDEYARRDFDSAEITALETSLERIASRHEDGGVVLNAARQIIARRG
jgi:trans-aconitate 2-methyltransferase